MQARIKDSEAEKLILPAEEYIGYLKDESRKLGSADSISFPQSEDELKDILQFFKTEKITIQGARTGITAGAVPKSGHVINLSKLNSITGLVYDKEKDNFFLKLQPGVLLLNIDETLRSKSFDTKGWSKESLEALKLFKTSGKWMFTPDPTERSASIGGMIACNASGACSYKYGSTRDYIESLRLLLVDGRSAFVRRGGCFLQGRKFSLELINGDTISGEVPSYDMPKVKNASGYYALDNMDLIDLFIGTEGTIAIISEVEIKLIKKPEFICGMTSFFLEEKEAISYIKKLRDETDNKFLKPTAIEFFNYEALKLLLKKKEDKGVFSNLGDIKDYYNTAVYIEYQGDNKEETLQSLFKAGRFMKEAGGCEEHTWVALDSSDMERLHFFRHATPEAVNSLIDERRKIEPRITKLGTDMAVPDESLEYIMDLYNTSLKESGLEAVIFGHIGDNHLHVNILPRNMEEYYKGKELYKAWARKVVEIGGTISAEHGIGKIKVEMLEIMYGQKGLLDMKRLKLLFDPENRLNNGNLIGDI